MYPNILLQRVGVHEASKQISMKESSSEGMSHVILPFHPFIHPSIHPSVHPFSRMKVTRTCLSISSFRSLSDEIIPIAIVSSRRISGGIHSSV